jgi:hypothetical protein
MISLVFQGRFFLLCGDMSGFRRQASGGGLLISQGARVTFYGIIAAIMDASGSKKLYSQFLQENRVKHFFMRPLNNVG